MWDCSLDAYDFIEVYSSFRYSHKQLQEFVNTTQQWHKLMVPAGLMAAVSFLGGTPQELMLMARVDSVRQSLKYQPWLASRQNLQ